MAFPSEMQSVVPVEAFHEFIHGIHGKEAELTKDNVPNLGQLY
jgi:hypothetical protein